MSKRWTDKSNFQWEKAGEGETNTWLTPPELVKRLGKFDIDPCAAGADYLSTCCNAMPQGDTFPTHKSRCSKCKQLAVFKLIKFKRPWDLAKENWTMADGNSLSRPWSKTKRMFINMPYGRNVTKWFDKCVEHNNSIVLIYARTSTIWFKKYVWTHSSGLLFMDDRLSFYDTHGNLSSGKPAANILVSFGSQNMDYLVSSKIPGSFIETANIFRVIGKKIN